MPMTVGHSAKQFKKMRDTARENDAPAFLQRDRYGFLIRDTDPKPKGKLKKRGTKPQHTGKKG